MLKCACLFQYLKKGHFNFQPFEEQGNNIFNVKKPSEVLMNFFLKFSPIFIFKQQKKKTL